MPLVTTLVGEIEGAKGLSVISSTVVAPVGAFVGTVTCSQVGAPANAKALKFSLDRTLWSDPAAKVSARVEKSVDGGTSWNPFLSFTAEGGVPGESFVASAVSAGEMFRGTLTVTGSFVSSAKMDFYG